MMNRCFINNQNNWSKNSNLNKKNIQILYKVKVLEMSLCKKSHQHCQKLGTCIKWLLNFCQSWFKHTQHHQNIALTNI